MYKCHPSQLSLLRLPGGKLPCRTVCLCGWGGLGELPLLFAAVRRKCFFSAGFLAESADLEPKILLMSVSLMASFCGKAGPLGDCTLGCAVTCSYLVSSRLGQSWEKAQPLPGVVLGEKNLFTDAESLFLCEVPPAHSVLFPELTVGSSAAVGAPPGRVLCGSASPGCSSRCSVPAGGTAQGTQHPSMWLSWSSALPWLPALLALLPATTPTPGSAAQHDPATFRLRHTPVSPQKPIHLCGCP